MSLTPDTAMVLAAGLGTRMRPYTDYLPKPLIKVAGKAMLDHALDRFAAAGVARAVVNVHYRADQIEAHLAARAAPAIAVSDERGLLLETGGGLARARRLLGEAPVYCTNTDAILVDDCGDEACAALARAFAGDRFDALLLVADKARASGYEGDGDFHLGADDRLRWRDDGPAPYVYTGLQIIRPSLLDDTPDGPFSMRVLWKKAEARGRFGGLVHRGRWMHVGDPAGLALAESFFDTMRHDARA